MNRQKLYIFLKQKKQQDYLLLENIFEIFLYDVCYWIAGWNLAWLSPLESCF